VKAKRIYNGTVSTAGGAVTQDFDLARLKEGKDANYCTIAASGEVNAMSLAIEWSGWDGQAWRVLGNTGASPITANGTTAYGFGWGAAAGAIITAAIAFPMMERMRMVMTPSGASAAIDIAAYVS